MPSILIIDDEQDIREIIQYNLKKEGFEVQTAENGIVGLQLAEEMLPDLIMLDVMMPLMDGIEVCEKLRANPKAACCQVRLYRFDRPIDLTGCSAELRLWRHRVARARQNRCPY